MVALSDDAFVGLINGLHVAGLVVGEKGKPACQDRASIIPTEGGLVLVLADGAGGLAGGALAANAVVAAVAAACMAGGSTLGSARFWVDVLEATDVQLARSTTEVSQRLSSARLAARSSERVSAIQSPGSPSHRASSISRVRRASDP